MSKTNASQQSRSSIFKLAHGPLGDFNVSHQVFEYHEHCGADLNQSHQQSCYNTNGPTTRSRSRRRRKPVQEVELTTQETSGEKGRVW